MSTSASVSVCVYMFVFLQTHSCVFPAESRASGKRSRPKSAFVVRDDEQAAACSTKRPTSSSIYRGGSANSHDPSRARPLTAYPSAQPHHYRGDGVAVGGGGGGWGADEGSHVSREETEKRAGARSGARRRPATALASSSSRSTTPGRRCDG